jgi:hypothetical protein
MILWIPLDFVPLYNPLPLDFQGLLITFTPGFLYFNHSLSGPPREIWGPGAKFDLGPSRLYFFVLYCIKGVRGEILKFEVLQWQNHALCDGI